MTAMKFIDFKADRCRHCYKCVRHCDVKAVRFQNGHAVIMPEKCILCGRCLKICPQSAKQLETDLDLVRGFIKNGCRVVASIAPSYMGLLDYRTTGQVRSALMQLGFEDVRETSEGAAYVTAEYCRLVREHQMDNIITTCCPSVNDLIEIYYPQLIPQLAPVVSPMIAHGRLIKEIYGGDVKVVFIGPCISKKKESVDSRHGKAVDAVLHFQDIRRWLDEENIVISDCPDKPFDAFDPGINRLYPVSNGIIQSVITTGSDEGNPTDQKEAYRKLFVHGSADCIDMCRSLSAGDIHNCFIEMNMCAGGCINGSAEDESVSSRFKTRMVIEDKVENRPAAYENENADSGTGHVLPNNPDMTKHFADHSVREPVPTEDQIEEILRMTDKYQPEDELNCGACGYPTCRDKAIAVYQGKAEVTMCIPFLHERAESLSNLVLDTSPNVIIVTDADMKILEYSAAAEKCFGKTRAQALEMYLDEMIDAEDFRWVLKTHQGIQGRRVTYDEYHLVTLQNIVYIEKINGVMGIFVDITRDEEREHREYEQKLETAELARNIISKQMTVVQEIAGLLGETTAETQVTLNRLCDSLLGNADSEGEGWIDPDKVFLGSYGGGKK